MHAYIITYIHTLHTCIHYVHAYKHTCIKTYIIAYKGENVEKAITQ